MKKTTSQIQTFLGQQTTVEGNLVFEGTVRLDGHLAGTVESKAGVMIVGETGVVNAEISVHTATVSGEVRGNIHATNRVELHPTARVFGDLSAPAVVIDSGAVLHGRCTMAGEGETEGKTIRLHRKSKALPQELEPGN